MELYGLFREVITARPCQQLERLQLFHPQVLLVSLFALAPHQINLVVKSGLKTKTYEKNLHALIIFKK